MKYNGNGFIPGIPARDLSDSDLAQLDDGQRQAVAKSTAYSGKLPPPKTSIRGIDDQIARALRQAGINTIEKIKQASDEELLAISGIGAARLAEIRAALED
jgi:DNA-directed RNA polymerase alpha subunit